MDICREKGMTTRQARLKLIAITNNEIKSISLEIQCKKYKTCRQCVYAQDPNCAWSTLKSKCVFAIGENEFLTQDIQNGDGMKVCNPDTEMSFLTNTAVYFKSESLQNIVQSFSIFNITSLFSFVIKFYLFILYINI